MTHEEIVQGSAEWKAIRCGRLTASRIADALATTKTGWGASRANVMAELIAERLTGVMAEGFTNAAMAWGVEKEAEARDAYEMARNVDVAQVAFVEHPAIKMAGASPDGLVSDDGLVEIKCPNTATHIETLLTGTIPGKYQHQMQFQMSCTGRLWCDWVSYDPRMPDDMQLFIKRLDRLPDGEMAAFEKKARDFLDETDAKMAALTSKIRSGA